MPFVEILAPDLPEVRHPAAAAAVTEALVAALGVAPGTVTLYVPALAPGGYAHAGASGAAAQRRAFVKIHAFRRPVERRRAAAASVTRAVAEAYALPPADVAVYFLDREPDEVAHDGRLESDARAGAAPA